MMTKITTYESEWKEMTDTLKEQNRTYKEFRYFLNLAKQQADEKVIQERKPKVILLGHAFPDEIIRALGEVPYYLLGGSFHAANLAENIVPRDTDSAIKSVLGMLTNEELNIAKDAILILPLTGDSMRKLTGVLGEKYKVVTLEVPSSKEDDLQKQRWREEILRTTMEVEKHLKKYMWKKNLLEQCRISKDAALVWKEFLNVCDASANDISGSGKLLIANSYHWCEDKTEWTDKLAALTEEIKKKSAKSMAEMPHLHTMLIGSPIYAPNYKIPFLVEEMGLELYAQIHPDMAHLEGAEIEKRRSRKQLLEKLADQYLKLDMSPAYIYNDAISDRVKKELDRGNIHGIIVHILKGQIEYDFEMNRLEKMIEQYELPVFRLETDYNYQDVEQLRIRLEAFAEMLSHRVSMGQMEVRHVKKAI